MKQQKTSECNGGCIPKISFSVKLWEAVNSPKHLISWSEDGLSVVVDPEKIEQNIMKTFPGLVQIPSFANFRRQMRWYGFNWKTDESRHYIFTHPFFQMERDDLLQYVVTRRREGRVDTQKSNFFDVEEELAMGEPTLRVTRSMLKAKNHTESYTDNFDVDGSQTFNIDIDENKEKLKLTKYNKFPNHFDVGTQTVMTVCQENTHFIGTIKMDSCAEQFFAFNGVKNSSYFQDIECTRHIAIDTDQDSLKDNTMDRYSNWGNIFNDATPDKNTDVPFHFYDTDDSEKYYFEHMSLSDGKDKCFCNL